MVRVGHVNLGATLNVSLRFPFLEVAFDASDPFRLLSLTNLKKNSDSPEAEF